MSPHTLNARKPTCIHGKLHVSLFLVNGVFSLYNIYNSGSLKDGLTAHGIFCLTFSCKRLIISVIGLILLPL